VVYATTTSEDSVVSSTVVVTIPHGISLQNSCWLRQLEVKEVTGNEEHLLAEIRHYPAPFRSSALLERVLRINNSNIAANAKINKRNIVQILPQGDRVALILNIRRIVFGDRISCTIACFNCKELMSFDLSVSELLQPVIANPKKEYPLQIEDYSLRVRPITGLDLELLCDNINDNDKRPKNDSNDGLNEGNKEKEDIRANLMSMAERLVRSSITFSDRPLPRILTRDFIEAVSSKLEEIDPQANMVLDLRCVACQHEFKTYFDAEEFVLSEIDFRARQLYQEVHWIAFYYHWEEDSILSLPLRRRKRYLDLINKTLSGENI